MGGETPSVFSDCQKTAAHNTAVFGTHYHTLFPRRYVVKMSHPGHAWSGHQVAPSDHLIKSLNARQSYTDQTIVWKLSEMHTSNSGYTMYILEFRYR